MTSPSTKQPIRAGERRVDPAQPLWRLAPTRGDDGRCLADFMMLIPGLGRRPQALRDQVAARVRDVCASYGGLVAFADINYSINVLWISVSAEPGLAGRVARSIRAEVPDALLIGGQLGAVAALPERRGHPGGLWGRVRRWSRRVAVRIEGPSA